MVILSREVRVIAEVVATGVLRCNGGGAGSHEGFKHRLPGAGIVQDRATRWQLEADWQKCREKKSVIATSLVW